MATPYVAGIAALYRSEWPALSVDEVQQRLFERVQSRKGPKSRVGRGLAVYRRD